MKLSSRLEGFPCCQKQGFTLVEIMIVVAIIAILAAIAIPNYLNNGKKSQRTVCIANLKTLDGAIEQQRLIGEAGEITMDVLCAPVGYIKTVPRCPTDKSGDYVLSGAVPVCPNVARCPDHMID